jgi:hypothetical protein
MTDEKRPTRAQLQARAYDEWADHWTGRFPITKFNAEEPEAALLMNAPPEALKDLHRRTTQALWAAGYQA